MFSYIQEFFADPKGMLIFFILAFPGRIMALSVHEFAHAWVANRCGDYTAKSLGRMTLNPLKHLDPIGTILMLVAGFGWAKPVPVNPLHYRNYRRDDLLVSIAGVTMNLIMFALSMLIMFAILAATVARAPMVTNQWARDLPALYRTTEGGQTILCWLESDSYYYAGISDMALSLPYISSIVTAIYGAVPGYLYQMLAYFAVVNIALCIFNLIPMPPLDGYHVLNDLILKKPLFANPRTQQITYTILIVLMFTGALSTGLGWVNEQVISGACHLARLGLSLFGLV